MSQPEPGDGLAEQPAATLLQSLKDGTLSPKALGKEQRQRCIEALLVEGYTHSHVAQLFQCSEKTVQRDVAEIRARNAAMPPSSELAKQLIGDYLTKTNTHHAHLMRLARTKEASVAERAQAEASAAKVLNDSFDRLQSLGYLPQRPQQVIGDFVHRVDGAAEEVSLEELEARLQEFRATVQELGMTPALEAQVRQFAQRLERLKLQEQLTQIQAQSTTETRSDEPSAGQ